LHHGRRAVVAFLQHGRRAVVAFLQHGRRADIAKPPESVVRWLYFVCYKY